MVDRDDYRTNHLEKTVSVKNVLTNDPRSRSERSKRKLFSSVNEIQPRISCYFPVLNRLDVEINRNKELNKELSLSIKHFLEKHSDDSTENDINESSKTQTSFLRKLMNTALTNTNKKKGGQRYNDTLKLFATYLFVIGGRMLYETLSANLPLPSLSTISRTLDNSGCLIIEGDMRVTELEKFLHMRKLPFYVWLSEDATRIKLVVFNMTLNRLNSLVFHYR